MTKKITLMIVFGLMLGGCGVKEAEKSEVMTTTPAEEQMVGNDADEHGCIGSAGYSWCEAKQKCLRIWEEACEEEKPTETVKEAVTRILTAKYNWEAAKVSVQVNKEVTGFASGSVGFGEEIGGGGWLARNVENQWEVVWDGNGAVDCVKLQGEYKFPDEILKPSFCD